MYQVLLIDDDTDILQLNKKFLEQDGYCILTASSSENALNIFSHNQPDCIILDIMMPGIDGYTLCEKFRKITDVPILFLSGKVTEDDKVHGFLCGADDYVTKPYSLKELSVRIQSHINRYHSSHKQDISHSRLHYPPLLIDLIQHKAYYNKAEIPLSNREFQLLHLLVTKINTPVSFKEIGLEMWGVYTEVDRRSIMVTASRLRKKIDSYPDLQNTIQTVWSKGYCFRYLKK